MPAVWRNLERYPEPRVLDLGTASGNNVNFFLRYSAGLSVADLRGQLLGARGAGSSLQQALRLEGVHGPFHVVLAWDLFDYLSTEQLAALGARLGELVRADGIVLCFLSYRAHIPGEPRLYRILDRDHLQVDANDATERPSPRIKEPQLRRAFPGFEVEGSYLLRNGLQEYLLRRHG